MENVQHNRAQLGLLLVSSRFKLRHYNASRTSSQQRTFKLQLVHPLARELGMHADFFGNMVLKLSRKLFLCEPQIVTFIPLPFSLFHKVVVQRGKNSSLERVEKRQLPPA